MQFKVCDGVWGQLPNNGCYVPLPAHWMQDMFGVNLAGLNYLKEQLARSEQDVFGDVQQLLRKRHKRTWPSYRVTLLSFLVNCGINFKAFKGSQLFDGLSLLYTSHDYLLQQVKQLICNKPRHVAEHTCLSSPLWWDCWLYNYSYWSTTHRFHDHAAGVLMCMCHWLVSAIKSIHVSHVMRGQQLINDC